MTAAPGDLRTFAQGLAAIIGRPSAFRPFVCDGSPLDCPVFIVGYNPATRMEGDWWQFWDDETGFRRDVWAAAYAAHRPKPSKTRARIDAIRQDLAGVKVLEATIDARPSARKAEYPRPVTHPFDYLLQQCRPTVVIAHGRDAVAHLQGWGATGTLIASDHFIYVGHVRGADIVAQARHALGPA